MEEVDDFDDVAGPIAIQPCLRRVHHLVHFFQLNLQRGRQKEKYLTPYLLSYQRLYFYSRNILGITVSHTLIFHHHISALVTVLVLFCS